MEIRDRIKELRRVRASELLPNPKNWRRHPKEQAAALRALLNEIGYADALIARELSDGRLQLLDGHLRADTAKRAIVPVLVLDVTEEEADKILATLDPLAAMAQTDEERVQALLATLQFESPALGPLLERLAGESAWQAVGLPKFQDPTAQVDRAIELKAKWGTEAGQLWQIGPHRLLSKDSREKAAVARLWANGGPKCRLVWTDPPYGVGYAHKNKFLNEGDRGNRIQKEIANDHMTADETEAMFAAALAAVVPFCEPGAAIYATVPAGPLYTRFVAAFEAGGFTFKHGLVWVKNQFVIGMSDYHYRHEAVLYGWLENGPHYFVADRTHGSVFEIDKPHLSDMHPTCKPVELIARMIANSSRPGEIVYDPFCGSASTILAAHQLGRIGYGCEIDPGYVAVALERLATIGLTPKLATA
jgi:DNA modification methylase